MPDGAVEPYFDSAAVIIVLVLLGQVLELRARSQTGAAIRALLGLAPKTARVIRRGGREEDVPLDHVQVGDLTAHSSRRESARRWRRRRGQQRRSTNR